jgi:hypothetical protein
MRRPGVAWLVGALVLAAACGTFAGCFTGSEGLEPPTDALYFPTALRISPGRSTLYVVNSDFDLQYNGGTVFAMNVDPVEGAEGLAADGIRRVAERVAERIAAGDDPSAVCAAIGSSPNANDTLYPGVCSAIDASPFVRAYATVGAFGSHLELVPNSVGPGLRLFVTVRGDPSVTYFDVVDDRDPANPSRPCDRDFCLECGGLGDELRCASSHLVGENLFTSERGLILPPEPLGLAASPSPSLDAIVVAHQTTGSASLVVNRWGAGDSVGKPFRDSPSLEFILQNLPDAPTSVAVVPAPRIVDVRNLDYAPGFVVTHRANASLSVLRFEPDAKAAPPRPFIVQQETVPISLSNDGTDSRGIVFDTTERSACEANCAESLCPDGDSCEANQPFVGCLTDCLDVPVGLYVVNRTPASLLVGRLETTPVFQGTALVGVTETFTLTDTMPLPLGAANVAVGSIVGKDGELQTRLFVTSFDARFVSIVDPLLRRVESSVRTGRGPLYVTFDVDPVAKQSHLYVSEFTDSYVSVIDLDSRRLTYGTALLNIGPPKAPREEQ